MERIQLSSGFSISLQKEYQSLFVNYKTPDGSEITGMLQGKKNLQILRKALTEVIGRRPINADGAKMRGLGDMIEKEVPGLAFVLLIAEFGSDHGLANYISNGTREDCIKWMRETADRLENNTSYPTPENN